MSGSDSKKGAADASKGTYNPPGHSQILPESKKEFEEKQQKKQDYREGYYDKKNSMKKK